MEKEKHKGFFKYMMSIYWSATVFTTVGYGDYHAVNGLEMTFNVISMLFYMLLNSYLSNVMSKLLQEGHHMKKFREDSEALRKFAINHQLRGGLHQDMYNSLIKSRDNQVPKSFNIQSLFPQHIQLQVKSAFSAKIAQTYVFNGVSPRFISLLVAEMELVTFETNEIVLLTQDYPKNLYVLIEGGIEGTTMTNPILRVCGEFGVICGLPQPYTVRTNHTSTLFSLRRKRLHQLMQYNRQDGLIIASNILQNLENQRDDPILGAIHTQVSDKFNRAEISLHLSIHFACQWGFPKLLVHLIKSGEDLEETNEQQMNILHILIAAVKERHDESCLRILIKYMNFTSVNQRDLSGQTPLCYEIAKEKPSLSLIELFRQRNIRLEPDKALSYYARAIDTNNTALLEVIPGLGGDINVADNSTGCTPLHTAVRAKKLNMVAALLNLGADRSLVDANGHTPLHFAEFFRYLDIAALLQA